MTDAMTPMIQCVAVPETTFNDMKAEIKRLRAALREIADIKSYSEVSKAIKVAAIARTALTQEPSNDR